MMGINHTGRVTNEEIYKRTHQMSLSSKVLQRQLTWIGHMLRREGE